MSLLVLKRTKNVLVYKIPYRRARAWPSGFRPSARASKGILDTKNVHTFH